ILSVARVGFIEIEIKDGLACICTNACRGIGQHGFHAERGNASGQCIAENATGFRLTGRSEEHTSELQSLMRISYAVFCLKKKKNHHIRNSRAKELIITNT